jgi:hypothetical protein
MRVGLKMLGYRERRGVKNLLSLSFRCLEKWEGEWYYGKALRGRLRVGRVTLDHVVVVRIHPSQPVFLCSIVSLLIPVAVFPVPPLSLPVR